MTTNVRFTISFDVRQNGHALAWSFKDGDQSLYHVTGPHAGAVHVEKGWVMTLDVTAFMAPDWVGTVDIVRATLATIPRGRPGALPASPFGTKDAVFNVDRFEPQETAPVAVSADTVSRSWTSPVAPVVAVDDGAWGLSVVLEVDVTPAGLPSYRAVYGFDPEYQVGPGPHP